MSDRNKKSKRTSSSMLPPPNSLEIFKVKAIDGVSFLITIRLDSQKLQIIGNSKEKNESKIIEI